MTNNERAEKILVKGGWGETTWSNEYRKELKAFIVSHLDEAFEEGFAAAQKKAAGIALSWQCRDGVGKCYPCDCGGAIPQDVIAEHIRKMTND